MLLSQYLLVISCIYSSDKKKGATLKKDFFTSMDALDFAIREKNQDAASCYRYDL